MSFKTSIRVEENATFGAVVGRYGDLMISLDGPFIEGTIVLKITQQDWANLQSTVKDAIIKDVTRKVTHG